MLQGRWLVFSHMFQGFLTGAHVILQYIFLPIWFLHYKTPKFTRFLLNQQIIANCLHEIPLQGISNSFNPNRCISELTTRNSVMYRNKPINSANQIHSSLGCYRNYVKLSFWPSLIMLLIQLTFPNYQVFAHLISELIFD